MGLILRLLMSLPTLSSRAYGAMSTYFRSHPVMSSVFAAGGVQGVIELAASGDEVAIQALSEAAAAAGIQGDPGTIATTGLDVGKSLVGQLSDKVSSFFTDDDVMDLPAADFEKIEAMKELARFIRGNISAEPRTVIRYHAMMREFLEMKPDDLERMLGAFL